MSWAPLPDKYTELGLQGIRQVYTRGSARLCEGNRAQMTIDFVCNKNAGLGKPTAAPHFGAHDYHHCNYRFVWESEAACPRRLATKDDLDGTKNNKRDGTVSYTKDVPVPGADASPEDIVRYAEAHPHLLPNMVGDKKKKN